MAVNIPVGFIANFYLVQVSQPPFRQPVCGAPSRQPQTSTYSTPLSSCPPRLAEGALDRTWWIHLPAYWSAPYWGIPSSYRLSRCRWGCASHRVLSTCPRWFLHSELITNPDDLECPARHLHVPHTRLWSGHLWFPSQLPLLEAPYISDKLQNSVLLCSRYFPMFTGVIKFTRVTLHEHKYHYSFDGE